MNYTFLKRNWIFALLLIPIFSAILALYTNDFIFKAGVAGGGILILFIMYFNKFKQSGDVWMILGAFLFSIAGDWFLSNRHGNTGMFIAGIALFFFAHVGYLTFALMNGRMHWGFTGLILAIFLLIFSLLFYPNIGDKMLLVAVLIYLLISCFSLGAAIGIQASPIVKWFYLFGIALVLFSDTLIAFREFAGYKQLNWLILPTYYLAQISVTLALIVRNRLSAK